MLISWHVTRVAVAAILGVEHPGSTWMEGSSMQSTLMNATRPEAVQSDEGPLMVIAELHD